MHFTSAGYAQDETTASPWDEDATETEIEVPGRPRATRGEPGRYAILRRLGSGGMGVVYKAYDHKMERLVAVKRLNPHRERQGGIARFFNEAKAIARLNHPNIVSIYDIVEDRRGFFIVMEMVRGISLRMWIKRHGALSRRTGLALLRQVAEALRYAHRQGIVHRDVKPGNILVSRGFIPKLVDFGVAMIGEEDRGSGRRRVAGTRGYLAPEARWNRGAVDARADIYSFGMTVLQTFSGQKPWMVQKYPAFVSDLILTATRENPRDRYKTLDDLLEDWETLETACADEPEETPEAVRDLLAPPGSKRDAVEIRTEGAEARTELLLHPVTLVGRSRSRCALCLDDVEVSRVHLKIVREEGEIYAFDMGSHNGTFVAGQEVRAVKLLEGMEIRIGNTLLRVL